MSNLSDWFTHSKDRWRQVCNDTDYRHGYWIIGYKIEPVAVSLSFQELRNAFIYEDDGSTFQASPTPVEYGNLLEKNKAKSERPQWWCATREGETFLVRPYAEDRTTVLADSMVKRISEIVSHAKRLANRIGPNANQVHYRLEWHGIKGRNLYHSGSVDALEDTALADPEPSVVVIPVTTDANDPRIIATLAMPFFHAFRYRPNSDLIARWLNR